MAKRIVDSCDSSGMPRLWPHVRAMADVLFPPRCVVCGSTAGPIRKSICERCVSAALQGRRVPSCPRCARSVAPFEIHEGHCRACRQRPPRAAAIVRVGPYAAEIGSIVRAYKFRAREELGEPLAEWMAAAVQASPWLDRVEGLVPVPTHWTHRLGRPLYPAEILATAVARKLRLPHLAVLRRVRGGPHQIGLSVEQRRKNVRGAFAMRRGVELRQARLLLIDDVKTTGATLDECAKVLLQRGAAEVYAAVVVQAGSDRDTDALPSDI